MSHLRIAALAIGALLAVSGCARPVTVEAAEFAPDPVCGQVILALPHQLGALEQVPTTSQATVAWGAGEIILRCGVAPPPPTDERCISVTSGAGITIDWIDPEPDSELIPAHADVEGGAWTFVTYGRVPAIEVVIAAASNVESPADILNALSLPVDRAPAERFCVGATDY
ncbi:MAG: DUF3515 domain-containing protein [Ruaniaceae bacterium]|nr:DUF3515 domain-containing protein [Ruaniaceae bacterium]